MEYIGIVDQNNELTGQTEEMKILKNKRKEGKNIKKQDISMILNENEQN